MKILSFGSLNYDHCYTTEHFVNPGETLGATSYTCNFGGKGLNQSIAIQKGGFDVYHAGKVGQDGNRILDYLQSCGVNTTFTVKSETEATGHAVIEIHNGENRILLYGGTNQSIDESQINETLNQFDSGDILLLQNEISNLPYLIKQASRIGMKIYFNAAPMSEAVKSYPLELVDTILVNETEGKMLSECQSEDFKEILQALHAKYPAQNILMTVGEKGSYYQSETECYYMPAQKVKAVDTTAAGDTYTGFFITSLLRGETVERAMEIASLASAIAVMRKGTSISIPTLQEVLHA